MAVTFTPNKTGTSEDIQSMGSLLALVGELTFSGSYTTGGDALDFRPLLRKIGGGKIVYVNIATRYGYSYEYDSVNRTVLVKQGDNANVAAGPEIEIPAAAYPAALTAPVAGNRVQILILAR